jgi:hypothetical protein
MSGTDPGRTSGEDAEARRRRLRHEVFGDVLPDTTADERDQGAPGAGESGNDEWLRSNVPPHHG